MAFHHQPNVATGTNQHHSPRSPTAFVIGMAAARRQQLQLARHLPTPSPMRSVVAVSKQLRRQLGTSLIELVVGMAIGLLVVQVAYQLQLSAAQQQLSMSQALQHDSAQRLGFRRIAQLGVQAGQSLASTSGQLVTLRAPSPTAQSHTEQLHIATAPSSTPLAADCLGRFAQIDGFMHSTFYVRNNSLRCNVADRSGGQPIVDGFLSQSTWWFVARTGGIQLVPTETASVLGHAVCLAMDPQQACNAASHHQAVAWSPSEWAY
jgi:hypothetical protein